MSHARQQIRDAVFTQLGTSIGGGVGSNKFKSRVYPHDTLPCVSVYTRNDQVDVDSSAMGDSRGHVLEIVVECRVKATTGYDDTLDDIASSVESLIAADTTLNDRVKDIDLISTIIDLSDESDQPTVLGVMTFETIYRYERTDPERIIGLFYP